MKKGLIKLGIIVLLLIIPFVSAIDTEINVKTLLNQKVSIQVLDPSQVYYLLNSYHLPSGNTGKVSVSYSGSEELINIKVTISENGAQVMLEKFDNIKTGEPVYLQLLLGNISENYMAGGESATNNLTAVNITAPNETVTQSHTNTSINATITGSAIAEIKSIPRSWYYIAIGIILLVLAGFLIFKKVSSKKSYSKTKIKPNTGGVNSQVVDKELAEAKKKIAEMQVEINKLKNKEKIQEAERKVEEDQKELEKLRRGL